MDGSDRWDGHGLGWTWAPDGTQPVRDGGEDALRAVPVDAPPLDASARRPGDVVIPAVPLGDDPRLAADAVTRWMDDDRAAREPTPAPTPHAPAPRVPAPPRPAPGEGLPRPVPAPRTPANDAADRVARWNQGAAPPAGPSAAGWVPVVALLLMLLVIAMVVVLGAG